MKYLTKAGVKFLNETHQQTRQQRLKSKLLAKGLRQKDIEGLGFRGPMGRGPVRPARPVIKKTLANVPIGQSSQGDGGSGLH